MTKVEQFKLEIRNKLEAIKDLTGQEKKDMFKEIKDLEADLEIEKELEKIQLNDAAKEPVKEPEKQPEAKKEVSVIHAMVKQVKQMPLTHDEKVAIQNVVNGEGNIQIKELSTQIKELLKDKEYLKDLITVHKTKAISGQFPVNKTEDQALVPVVDGVDMVPDTDLTFDVISFTISKYGKLGMLTDTTLKYTTADLMKYMAQVFVDAYVARINQEICDKLVGVVGTRVASEVKDSVEDLVSATRLDLNNALKQNAVILMTNVAFDHYAKQKNAQNGLCWVQPDLTKPATPYVNGYRVRLVDDRFLSPIPVDAAGNEVLDPVADVANIVAYRHPVVFGNYKEAVMMFENEEYTVSVSKEAGFLKNVVYSKIITYFDLEVVDDRAWKVYHVEKAI